MPGSPDPGATGSLRARGVRGRLSNALIACATGVGLTEEENREHGVDEEHVFHRVAFFLTAIAAPLFKRVLGAPDAPLRAIGAKRGEAGAGAAAAGRLDVGGGPSNGTTMTAASAAATPTRLANSVTDRVGGIPQGAQRRLQHR
jgi:hypothetical protein